MAVVGLLGLLAVAYSSGGPKQQAAPTALRFGVLLSVDQLPYFVMRTQGVDTSNGLTITETVVHGGKALLDAMSAGTIDMSFPGTVPVLNASRNGVVPASGLPFRRGG